MFVTCSKCDRQYWERDGHVCPPVYEVWDKDYSDEPKEIYAFDHQEAAENYLARYDAEYEWPDQIEVLVRKLNSLFVLSPSLCCRHTCGV